MDTKLANILASVFNINLQEITESLQQNNVAKWDSLTHMDLITTIEKEYQVELSMEQIVEMTSVKNIIAVLKQHGLLKNASP